MTNGHFIGIGGKYGAGKDVVANYYRYEFGFVSVGYGEILNPFLMKLNPYVMKEGSGIDLVRYADVVKARGYVSAKQIDEVRRLLQVFGTEIGRNMIHPDIWVDRLAEKVTTLREQGKSVVLTGVRYPNELEMVRRLGGETLWVSRPGHEETGSHDSEKSLSENDFDHHLVNDKSIGVLENRAGELYMDLFGSR